MISNSHLDKGSGRIRALVTPATKRPRPWERGRYEAQGRMKAQRTSPSFLPTTYFFFVGSFSRLVLARSRSCFSDIDSAIFLEGPFKLDFFCSPRFAAKAAPAAFCCFFERAGIPLYRFAAGDWLHVVTALGEPLETRAITKPIGPSEVDERA